MDIESLEIRENDRIGLIGRNGAGESTLLKILSGGEKTRLSIAAAFSKRAPLLFADESTTNLDMEGIEVLERMLAGYHGAVVLISNNRELLNHVCNQIWEINDGELRIFPGNYDAWLPQSQKEHDFAQFEYNSTSVRSGASKKKSARSSKRQRI